jgi:hypothetical protein
MKKELHGTVVLLAVLRLGHFVQERRLPNEAENRGQIPATCRPRLFRSPGSKDQHKIGQCKKDLHLAADDGMASQIPLDLLSADGWIYL